MLRRGRIKLPGLGGSLDLTRGKGCNRTLDPRGTPRLTRPPTPLAEGFQPASRADWQALVEKTLKGASADSLTIRIADGLEIEALYESTRAPRGFTPAPRGGARPWDIRTRVRTQNLVAARDTLLEDLAGAPHSAILALDWRGEGGVGIGGAEDLAELLDDVLVDVAPIGLDAGFLGPRAARWLSAAARGSPSAPLAFHLDPLSAFAWVGESPGSIEHHVAAAAEEVARLAPVHPNASGFLASGTIVHEAGGTPAGELAFALAAALTYAKAAVRAGLTMESAFGVIVLGLAADGDPLISIAKLRAARLLWTRLAAACGASGPAKIEARSSMRMLCRAEPWTNMIRLTAAGFGAAVGGADAIVLGAFTDALGPPTSFARRAARNTQLILMEEGRLGAVEDPVAGSGAFETMSRDLARVAWGEFKAIEAAGGVLAALREGLIARDVDAARQDLAASIASGELRLVGVTDFRADETHPAAVETLSGERIPPPEARLAGADSHCAPLPPISLEDLAR